MVWFKVDDKHHDHRKTRRALRAGSKRRDSAAVGLWCLAGSWSADNLMDGFVPTDELLRWDDDAETLAEVLVDAEFWEPATRDGEPGFQFVNWDEHQPTKADVEAKREAARERMRSVRSKGGKVSSREQDANVQANFARSSRDVRSTPSRPDPSRPVPTQTKKNSRPSGSETDEPNRFEEFWETYSHKVGRKKAESAYRSALKKPGINDEVLIAAAASYITWQMSEGKHPTYTKHPATWLNGEHWRDELSGRPAPQSRVQQHLALARQLAEEESGQMIPFPQIGGGSR